MLTRHLSRHGLLLLTASFSLVLSLFALPPSAHAEYLTVRDFRSQHPGEWIASGLTDVKPEPYGLHIRTSTEGVVEHRSDHVHPVDVISLLIASTMPLDAILYWPVEGSGSQAFQLPIKIPATESLEWVDIIPSHFPEWSRNTKIFGITFPAGSEVVIQEVRLRGWSRFEKVIEGWKSFWTFDTFTPYSINFLWGPLIVGNPPAREQLYDSLPPFGWSAVRIFYAILILTIVGCIGWAVQSGGKRTQEALGVCAAVFLALWLLFDLRMGSELLKYVVDDYRSYVMKESGYRVLRTHEHFFDIMEKAAPALRLVDRYGLITVTESPFYAQLRYMTYPSLPQLPFVHVSDPTSIPLWFVLARTDVYMNDAQQLVAGDGTVLTPPGQIIQQITRDSFLFVPHPAE